MDDVNPIPPAVRVEQGTMTDLVHFLGSGHFFPRKSHHARLKPTPISAAVTAQSTVIITVYGSVQSEFIVFPPSVVLGVTETFLTPRKFPSGGTTVGGLPPPRPGIGVPGTKISPHLVKTPKRLILVRFTPVFALKVTIFPDFTDFSPVPLWVFSEH